MSKTNVLKKFAALVLTLCVVSGCMTVSAASPDTSNAQYHPEKFITGSFGDLTIDDADAVQVPTIIIPGMTFSDFYLYDENGEHMLDSQGNIMRSDMMIKDEAEVSAAVKAMIKPLIKSVLCQSDKGVSEAVYNFISTLFKYQKNKPDGTGVYDVRVKTFDHPLSMMTQQEKDYYLRLLPLHSYGRIFGEENVYIYTYYMYGDVIKQGDELQDYIEMVKTQRNSSKVNIVTMSMGTTILNAWLDNDRADYSSINRLINIVPIYLGSDLITDVFARDFNLTDQFIYQDYLPIVTKGFKNDEYLGYLLNVLIKLLPQKTFERVLTRLTDAFIEALKNSSQMWSMITRDSYENLAEKYFSEPEYAPLKATTDKYYQAQLNLTENLENIKKAGGTVFTICGYGLDYSVNTFSMMSIVSHNATANSDCLIDLSYSSLGATHVSKGQQLSDEYISGLTDKKYLSPDKSLDASTCQFPDTTWFFTNQSHWAFGNDVMINTVWMIMAGMIDDIYTSPEYFPQFNGCRDTYAATLTYMYAAEKILENPGEYDEKLVAELQDAFDEMRDIYNITNLNYETSVLDGKASVARLQNALAALGVCSPATPAEIPSWGSFAKWLSGAVFKIYGPRGFFDWLNIRNLFN